MDWPALPVVDAFSSADRDVAYHVYREVASLLAAVGDVVQEYTYKFKLRVDHTVAPHTSPGVWPEAAPDLFRMSRIDAYVIVSSCVQLLAEFLRTLGDKKDLGLDDTNKESLKGVTECLHSCLATLWSDPSASLDSWSEAESAWDGGA
jgi:hypothetical protein